MVKRNDREIREMRVTLGKRTEDFDTRSDHAVKAANDPEHVRLRGDEISAAIRGGDLEGAREMLEAALETHPEELRFLNLLTLYQIYAGPFEGMDGLRRHAVVTLARAVGGHSEYYVQACLTNLGLIAQMEGQDDYSLALHLAAHSKDRSTLPSMQNLAEHYASHSEGRESYLPLALRYVEMALEHCPQPWYDQEDIVDWLTLNIKLANLRGQKGKKGYQPFLERIWSVLREHRKL